VQAAVTSESTTSSSPWISSFTTQSEYFDQIADHLAQTTTENARRVYWAHGLLRLVDWRLRHSPEDDLGWLPRAEALAGL